MNVKKPTFILALALVAFGCEPILVNAQETVECGSHNYQYTECQAPLDNPQLIHQQSSSSCIINRTWGFNRKTQRIWVAEGCSGVFADVGGYHYGRGDGYDKNARHYDEHGHDNGNVVAGVVAAVLVAAALSDSSNKKAKKHTTSNNTYSSGKHKHGQSGYDGCHGLGCTVDDPGTTAGDDSIDPRPQFDKDGNPNFDTKGNWIGCHGLGCTVDNPENGD